MNAPADPYWDSTAELARVMGLPIYGEPTEELAEQVTASIALPDAIEAGFRLLRVQAWAIALYPQMGGRCFCPIGVGGGKTLATIGQASLGYQMGFSRILLVLPANKVAEMAEIDLPWSRSRIRVETEFWFPSLMNKMRRDRLLALRPAGCYVVSYTMLSREFGQEILEALQPDAFIFDEAHNLAGQDSTRSSRVFRYIRAKKSPCSAMSGTMANRSILDYHHIAAACLDKARLFMPSERHLAADWDGVIGSERNNLAAGGPDPRWIAHLDGLRQWANLNFGTAYPIGIDGIRHGFRLRMMTAPGVVYSHGDEVDVSIDIKSILSKAERNEQIKQKVADLEAMRAPDGTELASGMQKWGWNWQLSAGVYYSHVWPPQMGEALIHAGNVWLQARNDYNKQLREYLKTPGHKKYDSPKLVGQAFYNGRQSEVGDAFLYELWCIQRDLRIPLGTWKRKKIGHRVCYSGIQAVRDALLERELKNEGCIVWYQHQVFGRWLAEELEKHEFQGQVVFLPGGSAAGKAIDDPSLRNKIMVCSLDAHGTGKNLQFMGQALFAQLPKTAKLLNQALGRIHRTGQTRDSVYQSLLLMDEWCEAHLWALLLDAVFLHATQANKQKALLASWSGHVREFPESYLRERGFELARVSEVEKAQLRARFDPRIFDRIHTAGKNIEKRA